MEFYDLSEDPYQLENTASELREEAKDAYSEKVNWLTSCSGRKCSEPDKKAQKK